MELRFKTASFDKALRVASSLFEARSNSHQPLMPNEVSEWVEQRFPLLPEQDRAKLVSIFGIRAMEAIDG